ncbi:MAG TPA: glycosyltransferase [Chitinophagaceae bacterium]|nr:glycosyltransferase [Chitinophagaceae bacterium]
MRHILYLPSWFPNRRDPFSGDFIKRFAESASLYNRITVFFTAIDDTIREAEFTEEKINENFTIYVYYYPSLKGISAKIQNGLKRFFALKKIYKKVFVSRPPDIVHVHVSYPAGLFALYLKKRKSLEYIISEQNCIYMPGYDNTYVPGRFEKKMNRIIYDKAKRIHAVSKSLANALTRLGLATTEPVVIPNVVNTSIFRFKAKEESKIFRFIHASLLVNQKNPEGMLAALSIVRKKRDDFILKVLGPATEKIRDLVEELRLKEHIIFMNEVPYIEVAHEISRSDAMIHFTRYETFGCVIAESLCCGVPVIISDLEVTRELIKDKVNGLLVRESDINDLADKILYFMENGLVVNSKLVAEESQQKFNYSRIGKAFDELYTATISKN